MAFSNYQNLRTFIENAREHMEIANKGDGIADQGFLFSTWLQTPFAGAAPTTAVVPDNTTTGALGQANGGSGALYPGVLEYSYTPTSLPSIRTLMLCDRLSHQGGLNGTTVAAQTTNLPTAALTRYTSGVGVFFAAEIYTLIGTTAQTVTCDYTDQDGNSATTPAFVIGGTGWRNAGRFIVAPLAAGDTGVRAVANFDLSGSTGTAGNIGITLFKPLLTLPVPAPGRTYQWDPLFVSGGNFCEIVDNACLFWLAIGAHSSGINFCASIPFMEAP